MPGFMYECFFYCIDKSILVENSPLVKFIRNYIQDWSDVFSMFSLVKISMMSFPAFYAVVCAKILLS